jgi:hypothetical protein
MILFEVCLAATSSCAQFFLVMAGKLKSGQVNPQALRQQIKHLLFGTMRARVIKTQLLICFLCKIDHFHFCAELEDLFETLLSEVESKHATKRKTDESE